jgi:hypothetical protein
VSSLYSSIFILQLNCGPRQSQPFCCPVLTPPTPSRPPRPSRRATADAITAGASRGLGHHSRRATAEEPSHLPPAPGEQPYYYPASTILQKSSPGLPQLQRHRPSDEDQPQQEQLQVQQQPESPRQQPMRPITESPSPRPARLEVPERAGRPGQPQLPVSEAAQQQADDGFEGVSLARVSGGVRQPCRDTRGRRRCLSRQHLAPPLMMMISSHQPAAPAAPTCSPLPPGPPQVSVKELRNSYEAVVELHSPGSSPPRSPTAARGPKSPLRQAGARQRQEGGRGASRSEPLPTLAGMDGDAQAQAQARPQRASATIIQVRRCRRHRPAPWPGAASCLPPPACRAARAGPLARLQRRAPALAPAD